MFRGVNERIEAGQWPGERDQPVAFRCECGSIRCNRLVELTLEEYEAVRADAKQFVVLVGHEIPAVERIVDREPAFVVVEKVGEAGRLAEDLDPRQD
jgi:hypothetical protein